MAWTNTCFRKGKKKGTYLRSEIESNYKRQARASGAPE